MLASHAVIEIRRVEVDALDTGRRIDGHGEHLMPLGGISQVWVRLDERLFSHGTTIA